MDNEGYVLIVEDSPTQARHLESVLKRLGHQVYIACNGKEAITLINKERPLTVIADILMPEMDGYQLCKMIKSDHRYRDVPVVLLTQLSDPKEIIRGLESGADDFIVKPCSEDLILTRIQSILSLKLRRDVSIKQVTILVVEDSPTQAEQIRFLLEGHGYMVIVAANGREGLDLARRERPTIIVSDILMPVMGGYEMAYEIKHDKELKDIPVIFVTSITDSRDVVKKASVVADGYFTKPFDEAYLISKIESLIAVSKSDFDTIDQRGIEVSFAGEHYVINAGRRQILSFLLSTYENAVQQNRDLIYMHRELRQLNEQLEAKIIERTSELRASKENFKAIAENASDGIIISVSGEGNVYANRRLAEITGYRIQDLLNIDINGLICDDGLSDIMKTLPKITGGKPQSYQYETSVVNRDKQTIPVEIALSRTIWQNKEAVIVIIRDITERKKREEYLLKRDKLESVGVLAGGIAHDFNNLLTGILGNISLAKISLNPEDSIYKIMMDAEKASIMARDLTWQLLTFSKGGAPIRQTASISELIRDSATFSIRGANIKCAFTIPEDLGILEIDKAQISQVIQNIIINAEQAMLTGGIIYITAENVTVMADDELPLNNGNYVKITIKDTGIGIPEELRTKIFDPYFTTKEGGSGLGLATAYSIIKNHDGYISIESEVGKGTSFHIYLPVSKEGMPADTGIGDKEEELFPGKGRVLVMDDEEVVRGVVGAILNTLGYEVEFAEDGSEAIELYKQAQEGGKQFDVVIMDLTIPGGMGGGEAIKKLLEINPDSKVIVSSGYSDDAIMSSYKKYGFSAVIAKPFRFADLSRVVHQVMSH